MIGQNSSSGLTRSEQYVSYLSKRAFLSLWTHTNPIGKNGKELCDCLVVCGNHVIIISVKEIKYKDTGDKTGLERWTKAAIKKSVDQIVGAERWISGVDLVLRRDGRKIELPPKKTRKTHRLSVSLGSDGKVPIMWGDFGNGFVHVCDEVGLNVVFSLMDTITDFTEFLSETELLFQNEFRPLLSGGGIEDLASIFLQNGYRYPWDTSDTSLIIIDDIWQHFSKSKDLKEYFNRIERSYKWDSLIEYFVEDLLTDGMFEFPSSEITDDQHALIEMALQPRAAPELSESTGIPKSTIW